MANTDDDNKSGANGGADEKSTKAGTNTDDANSGKSAADKNKSDEGKGSSDSKQVVFESQDAVDRMIQKRIDRALKDKTDEANLSKEQLLEKQRDDAMKELRVSNARDAFISQSKISDYGKASKLFRMYSSDLEFDDNGKVTNMSDVLKEAKADWPDLFGKVPAGSGDLGGGKRDGDKSAGADMNTILRRSTGRA